ncbi:MAG: hypothetical protein D3907_06860, partial [Candidatus Electrothrix sp. AUS3]|nr:hypothetical protein [Candidatus Electrothrix gigas]
YFKRIVAGLRNIFGGNVQSYETLVDRARREAVIIGEETSDPVNRRWTGHLLYRLFCSDNQ